MCGGCTPAPAPCRTCSNEGTEDVKLFSNMSTANYHYLTPLTELPTLSRAGEKVAKPAMPGITVSTSPLTNQS